MMHAGLRPVDHLVIENDGKNETEQPFGTLNYQTATQEELVSFMMNAGIVGCGGAGFPSYVKYRGCKGIDLLIINAVECEPYITADYKNTSLNMQDLVTGVAAMLKMSGASGDRDQDDEEGLYPDGRRSVQGLQQHQRQGSSGRLSDGLGTHAGL